MPVIAVALGALVADEAIAVTTVVGGTIVCAGVYVGARRS
jgi:drug/metabolite transporter (DMT)-like permease